MAATLDDVALYCSSTESSATQEAALFRVLSEVESQRLNLKKLVELLGPYLTSPDDIQRSRGSCLTHAFLAPRDSFGSLPCRPTTVLFSQTDTFSFNNILICLDHFSCFPIFELTGPGDIEKRSEHASQMDFSCSYRISPS